MTMAVHQHLPSVPVVAEARELIDIPQAPRFPARPAPRSTVMCISSEALLAGATEVQIEHHGAVYRLKQTSLGKLILTK